MSTAPRRRRIKTSSKRSSIEFLESRVLLSAAYTVTDLGTLGNKNSQSVAYGINDNGQVVGYSTTSPHNGSHPFLYSNGQMINLDPQNSGGEAWSINNSGQVVGKDGDAFLYANGSLQSIGRLPGGNTSFAYAINNSGQIAGDSLTQDPSITHAFLYTNGQMQDLGTLGGAQSNAFGLNNHGDIVGLAYTTEGVSHAFFYSNGTMQDIGQLWGPASSVARGVNDSGEAVGYGYFLGLQPRHAFAYQNGTITDLQTLGGESSAAMGINNAGQIVGDSNTSTGDDHAFVYSNGQMQDLNGLISSSSGWVLQQANSINNVGQIVGTGTIDGHQHAFLLTPIQAPTTGSISGVVYNDANGNKKQDVGEAGLAGWTVFVDTNGNGVLDSGEPSATTGSDGSYTINGLAPGSYTVDEVVKSGYTHTTPASASVEVTASQTASVGAFGNALTPTPPSDTTPPTASIVAPGITAGGGTTETITVVYSDNVAVKASTIDAGDLSVTGPAGALTITKATANGGNGATVVATYTVAAPGGSWDSTDNGSYIVSIKADQVSDTSGNFVGGVSSSFAVNVPASQSGNGSDQTFNNGQAIGTNFVTEAVISQQDGKVITVGREGDLSAGKSQGIIERFNSDGSLDKTFGSNGMIVSAAGLNEAYFAVIMPDANHFVVAGTSDGDFVLTRYALTGRIDATFGNAGRVLTDFGTSSDTVRGLALTAGGMIIAGGDSGSNLAFARYTPSGALDSSFAQGGRQLFGLGSGTSNGVGTIAVDSEGRVIAAAAEGASVVVARLTPSGEADGTFGDGGLVTVPGIVARTDLGAPDRSEGLAVQSDGSILVANRTSSGRFGLVRLTQGGTVDSTFGINGLVTASFGGDDDADSILLQSSGAIMVIGTSLQSGTPDAAIALFDSSGALIGSFGNNGLMLLPGGGSTPSTLAGASIHANALHVGDILLKAFGTVTPDGRVIVGTSNDAVAATTSSTLRRLVVPGIGIAAGTVSGTLLGDFGLVSGKMKTFKVTDADGTRIIFSLTGGTGQVYQSGNVYNIAVDDLGKGVVLRIFGAGGDRRVSIGDISVSGTVRTLIAVNTDLSGTLHVTGAIGTVQIGNISGSVWSGAGIANLNAADFTGNVYATTAIGRLRFHKISGTIASGGGAISMIQGTSMDSARILSGAKLGTDGAIGGTGTDADTFAGGAIGSIRIAGDITSSFIGAGVNPVDRTFGNANDTVAGTAASDRIAMIRAKSADAATRVEAGAFGKIFLPKLVDVTTDPRFAVL